ncbi:hypothetical protein P4O66_014475, partial [Electrophorus voltai]
MSSIGRRVGIFRAGVQFLRRRPSQVFVRKAGGGEPHIVAQYRQPPQITKNQKFQSELLSGAMWFWILWHMWHDLDAVLPSLLTACPSDLSFRVISLGQIPQHGQMRSWEFLLTMSNVVFSL